MEDLKKALKQLVNMAGKYGLDTLIKENRFGDVFLLCWVQTEMYIDRMVLGHYGLLKSNNDLEVQFVIHSSFENKLNFLKKQKIITNDEYEKIHTFQLERNKLVHFSPKGEFFKRFYDDDKRNYTLETALCALGNASTAFYKKFED